MANEISLSAVLSCSKGGLLTSGSVAKTATLAGSSQYSNVQNIGTSAEALDFGEGVTVFIPQYALFINQDQTNYVELCLDAGATQIFAKLMPGDPTLLPCKTGAMWARANTAAVNLLVVAIGA